MTLAVAAHSQNSDLMVSRAGECQQVEPRDSAQSGTTRYDRRLGDPRLSLMGLGDREGRSVT